MDRWTGLTFQPPSLLLHVEARFTRTCSFGMRFSPPATYASQQVAVADQVR